MVADAFPAPIATLVTELLHEMGQPLTTLQACGLLPLLPPGDRDALASEMAGQVARVTELYRELRLLLAAAMPASAEPGKLLNLSDSLRGAVKEWARQAERQEVNLLLHLPPQGELAIEVSPRTEHAIRSTVAHALANAPAGSQLRVSVSDQPHDGSHLPVVSLEVFCSQCTPEPTAATPAPTAGTPAAADIGLRVAKALLEAEGGRVIYRLQPFRATIELPHTGTLPAR